MKPRISLRQTLSDHNLLGGALAGDSWKAWRCLLIAAMVEELTNDERAIFTKLTGREREPLRPVEDFVAVVGRRGGKSRALATLIAYISGLAEHSSLVPGERGLVLFIAPDTRQANIALGYCVANFEQSPILIAYTSSSGIATTGSFRENASQSFRSATSQAQSRNPSRDFLALLNSGRVVLPKHDKLVHQLVGLERRTSRRVATRSTTRLAATSHCALMARKKSGCIRKDSLAFFATVCSLSAKT